MFAFMTQQQAVYRRRDRGCGLAFDHPRPPDPELDAAVGGVCSDSPGGQVAALDGRDQHLAGELELVRVRPPGA